MKIENDKLIPPEDWREVKLGEVVKFGNGKTRPKTKGVIPVYGGNGILGYAAQNNYEGETIIVGRVGAYCGSVYFENKPIWISDNALSAKPKNGNNAKFFFYFLKNLNLNQISQGSSHPLVTQTLLNTLDVVICNDKYEQKAIAEVLSSLDDKIDLLHRQNKTLESIAQTLFRQWFIEEAQDDWEEVKLGDIVDISSGKSLKMSEYNPTGKYPVLGANGEIGKTNNYLSDEKLIFTALFVGMLSMSAFASEFCNGFERGYITGYKQSSGSSFDPFTPFCPFQPFKGFNDPESDYEHGYIIGCEKGLQVGRK